MVGGLGHGNLLTFTLHGCSGHVNDTRHGRQRLGLLCLQLTLFLLVVHEGDVLAQLGRTLGNIDAILRSGGASLGDLMSIIVYLRDPTDYPRIYQALRERLPDVPATFVRAPVCRPAWLIEIEGIAVTG